MIPVLFPENSRNFESMGICSLSLTTKAVVRRVLNGKDELELSYPVTGQHFSEIQNSRIILVRPEYQKKPQPYRIYKISKPLKGFITVYARHVSEQKSFTIVRPFSANTINAAVSALSSHIVGDNPFTFWTDKTDTGNYHQKVPMSLGSVLGGNDGSILDVFGGEFEFDEFDVRIWNRRGVDRGVSVQYAKNMTALEVTQAVDETVITSICPVWHGIDDNDVVHLPEYVVDSLYVGDYPFRRAVVVDFSGAFESRPSEEALRNMATQYIQSNHIGIPSMSVKVSFEHLAQYEEYRDFAMLETINLGDTISIHHAELGVDVESRVVETTFDVLIEKYTNITVGSIKNNMGTALGGLSGSIAKNKKEEKNYINEAVSSATSRITGESGGYIVTNFDNLGNTYELLVMDDANKLNATYVMRLDKDGIAFSKNGYSGPYHLAWTLDGILNGEYLDNESVSSDKIDPADFSLSVETDDPDFETLHLKYTDGVDEADSGMRPGKYIVSGKDAGFEIHDANGIVGGTSYLKLKSSVSGDLSMTDILSVLNDNDANIKENMMILIVITDDTGVYEYRFLLMKDAETGFGLNFGDFKAYVYREQGSWVSGSLT